MHWQDTRKRAERYAAARQATSVSESVHVGNVRRRIAKLEFYDTRLRSAHVIITSPPGHVTDSAACVQHIACMMRAGKFPSDRYVLRLESFALEA